MLRESTLPLQDTEVNLNLLGKYLDEQGIFENALCSAPDRLMKFKNGWEASKFNEYYCGGGKTKALYKSLNKRRIKRELPEMRARAIQDMQWQEHAVKIVDTASNVLENAQFSPGRRCCRADAE